MVNLCVKNYELKSKRPIAHISCKKPCWVDGWMDGWKEGRKEGRESGVKDCLQQSTKKLFRVVATSDLMLVSPPGVLIVMLLRDLGLMILFTIFQDSPSLAALDIRSPFCCRVSLLICLRTLFRSCLYFAFSFG